MSLFPLFLIKNSSQYKDNFYKYIITIALILFFFIAGYVISQTYTIGFNLSASFPEKVFVLEKKAITENIRNGDIVYALPPENNYVPKGKMIIKKVACGPGQTLNIVGDDYYCDHSYLVSSLSVDSRGNKIDKFVFNGVIPKDKYFLAAFNSKSFDSRYFGLVDRTSIKGKSLWKF